MKIRNFANRERLLSGGRMPQPNAEAPAAIVVRNVRVSQSGTGVLALTGGDAGDGHRGRARLNARRMTGLCVRRLQWVENRATSVLRENSSAQAYSSALGSRWNHQGIVRWTPRKRHRCPVGSLFLFDQEAH
jgi:hypothetical protein